MKRILIQNTRQMWIILPLAIPKHLTFNDLFNRLEDKFTQSWSGNVNNSANILNFRLFKTSHNLEHYLNILDDIDIIILSSFMAMDHKLPIENNSKSYHENRESMVSVVLSCYR